MLTEQAFFAFGSSLAADARSVRRLAVMQPKARKATLVGLWVLLGILVIVCVLLGVIFSHPAG